MLLQTTNQPLLTSPLVIQAADQRYRQIIQICYVGCLGDTSAVNMPEIKRQIRLVRACYNRFKRELYDVEDAPFTLQVRMLVADMAETLLYGCVTYKLRQEHFPDARTVHDNLLGRITSFQHR